MIPPCTAKKAFYPTESIRAGFTVPYHPLLYQPKLVDISLYQLKLLEISLYQMKLLEISLYQPKLLDICLYERILFDISLYQLMSVYNNQDLLSEMEGCNV